jgi:hypothetical protein
MTEESDTPIFSPDDVYGFHWKDLGICIGAWIVLSLVVAFV